MRDSNTDNCRNKRNYSEASLILLNAEACRIYEVPIAGQNELECANCRVPDTTNHQPTGRAAVR